MAQEDVGMPRVGMMVDLDPPDLEIVQEEGGDIMQEEDPHVGMPEVGMMVDLDPPDPESVQEEGGDNMQEGDPLDDVVDANTEAPQGNLAQMEAGLSQLSELLVQAKASQVDIGNEILCL